MYIDFCHSANEVSLKWKMFVPIKSYCVSGFFDIDHTYKKPRHDRDGRSRSRDRDKIHIKTPDSSKGKEIKGKALKKGKTKINNVTRRKLMSFY